MSLRRRVLGRDEREGVRREDEKRRGTGEGGERAGDRRKRGGEVRGEKGGEVRRARGREARREKGREVKRERGEVRREKGGEVKRERGDVRRERGGRETETTRGANTVTGTALAQETKEEKDNTITLF